jgi:hypothetical protein
LEGRHLIDVEEGRVYTEIDTILQLLGLSRRAEGEADEGQRGCLLLIVGAVVVGASAWMASREIVYLWRGQIVDATVVRTLDLQTERPHTIIDFDYADPQTKESRLSSTEMPLGWRAPGGRLKIECVPGSDTFARVQGSHQRWSLWVFGASLIAMFAYVGWLIREANTPIRRNWRR